MRYLPLLALLLALAGCTAERETAPVRGETEGVERMVEGDPVTITMGLYADDLAETGLRSDGIESVGDVKTLRLLVFDEQQKFLYTADATLEGSTITAPEEDEKYLPDGSRDGIEEMHPFKVRLYASSRPRYIHFIANFDWTGFDQDYFLKGTSAGQLIPRIRTKVGDKNAFSPLWSMIRVEEITDKTAEGMVVKMLRNYAKVEFKGVDEAGKVVRDGWTVDAYTVAHTNDLSLVAPFKTDNFSFSFPFNPTEPSVPVEAELQKVTNDAALTPISESFNLFESYNDSDDDKVCIVIRGTNGQKTRYFKIDLAKQKEHEAVKHYIPVLRNHIYRVDIKSIGSEGYGTIEEALTAPADNNIFASVELQDFIKVSDGTYRLTTDPIQIVITKPGTYSFRAIYSGQTSGDGETIVQGLRDYLRFFPEWETTGDTYISEWKSEKEENDSAYLCSFTVDRIPSDEILEYRVGVVGLRTTDPNWEEGGEHHPESVIDGITGATTPITRTVRITLRTPFIFNAEIEDDTQSEEADRKLLTFQTYSSLPESQFPFEVLVEADQMTMLSTGDAKGKVRIVNRGNKVYYSYTVTHDVWTNALEQNGGRIAIPMRTNDGSDEWQGTVALSSDFYRDESLYQASEEIKENELTLMVKLPKQSRFALEPAVMNHLSIYLDDGKMTKPQITLQPIDYSGHFKLRVLDSSIDPNTKLRIATEYYKVNDYGKVYFWIDTPIDLTLQDWLDRDSEEPIVLTPTKATVTGQLRHTNRIHSNSWERPGVDGYDWRYNYYFLPRVYAYKVVGQNFGGRVIRDETDITDKTSYWIDDQYVTRDDGMWWYPFTITIPKEYLDDSKYDGIGLTYRRSDDNQYFEDYGTPEYKTWEEIWKSTGFDWIDPKAFL